MCSPMPLRRRAPRRPPPKPPPKRMARAKPALETRAHSKILEPTIRSPVTPTLVRKSRRCARPCRFVGGRPGGPLRNLPQNGWRGQSPRSKPARTPRSSNRRFAPLSRPLSSVNHDDVLAHAAVVVREADRGGGDLPGAGLAAQLGEDLRRLRHAGGAERMAAPDQS